MSRQLRLALLCSLVLVFNLSASYSLPSGGSNTPYGAARQIAESGIKDFEHSGEDHLNSGAHLEALASTFDEESLRGDDDESSLSEMMERFFFGKFSTMRPLIATIKTTTLSSDFSFQTTPYPWSAWTTTTTPEPMGLNE